MSAPKPISRSDKSPINVYQEQTGPSSDILDFLADEPVVNDSINGEKESPFLESDSEQPDPEFTISDKSDNVSDQDESDEDEISDLELIETLSQRKSVPQKISINVRLASKQIQKKSEPILEPKAEQITESKPDLKTEQKTAELEPETDIDEIIKDAPFKWPSIAPEGDDFFSDKEHFAENLSKVVKSFRLVNQLIKINHVEDEHDDEDTIANILRSFGFSVKNASAVLVEVNKLADKHNREFFKDCRYTFLLSNLEKINSLPDVIIYPFSGVRKISNWSIRPISDYPENSAMVRVIVNRMMKAFTNAIYSPKISGFNFVWYGKFSTDVQVNFSLTTYIISYPRYNTRYAEFYYNVCNTQLAECKSHSLFEFPITIL